MGGAYWRVGVAYNFAEVGAEDDLTRERGDSEALPARGREESSKERE